MRHMRIGSSGPQPIEYLFVDGGYFRDTLKRKADFFFDGESIELDYNSFFRTRSHKRFYYDCLPPRKTGETTEDYEKRIAPTKNQFDSLRAADRFHVFLGTTASEGKRARQKGVDIMIAVHMLAHAFRGNMDRATLLTGDLDFKPLIEALVQDGMDVTLWCDQKSASAELIYAADSISNLLIEHILPHTKEAFRQRHPVPQVNTQQGATVPDGFVFVERGKTSDNLEVSLHELSGKFLIIVANVWSGEMSLYAQHRDPSFLKKLLDERGITVTWQ